MPRTDVGSVAVTSLRAWTTGDFATARSLLHEDITFAGPLGVAEGVEAYLGGLRNFARLVRSAEVHRVIADGDDVCIVYDLVTDTPAGTIPTAGWYQIRDGKIASVRAFFDARPFGQPQAH